MFKMLSLYGSLLSATLIFASNSVVPAWHGASPRDLHHEYGNIFRHGNRNAASHLWSSFVLQRSSQMNAQRFEDVASGYCAVSGSPVQPQDYTRYLLRLDSVEGKGKRVQGYMYYCCWPCVCDTQDFFKVDTVNVSLAGGVSREYHVAVLGNPCEHPEALTKPFTQPFDWGGPTTLAETAAEVRCDSEGRLIGATLSKHGYPIYSLFFNAEDIPAHAEAAVAPASGQKTPTPGRMSHDASGVAYQDEFEFKDMCEDRARNGYNSGMGEIFRKVASITKVVPGERSSLMSMEGTRQSINQSDL